jgi:hypothetical protein
LDFDVAKARSDHKYLQTYAKKAEAAYARRDYKGGTAFERWAKSVVAAGEGLIQALTLQLVKRAWPHVSDAPPSPSPEGRS